MSSREDTLTEKADAAFRQVAVKVIERARQTGTPIILWEEGKVVERTWEEVQRSLEAAGLLPSGGEMSAKR
jgi:hypothetical protein